MALPEDVVLYDLDAQADVDALIAMANDPAQRWFARARLAGLAVKGMVAATWNPHLHPRGKDGQFIRKFGWVRWLSDGAWRRGQVISINADTGNAFVRFTRPNGIISEVLFSPSDIEDRLYTLPTPKGTLSLPDPLAGIDNIAFKKVGGQGGSNPGGMYAVDGGVYGDSGELTPDLWDPIVERHEMKAVYPGAFSKGDRAIARWGNRVALAIFGSEESGKIAYFDTDGNPIPEDVDIPSHPATQFFASHNTDKAWGEVAAVATLLNEGQKVYIKHAKSEDHAKNEVLANRLYELAGVNVAETIMGDDGITIGSKVVPFTEHKVDIGMVLDDEDVMHRMRRDFVIDAWLANWDVAGLALENTQVVDGYPYRIDAGGALLYRAQGSPKGAVFGPTVGELETLRDAKMNPAAAKVFGKTTDAELQDGAERLAAIEPELIYAMVEASGLPPSLGDTLVARRDYILATLNVAPLEVEDVPEPTVVEQIIPEKAKLPEPEAVVVPSTPHLVWDSENQIWVKGVVSPPGIGVPLATLAKIYDDESLFTDIQVDSLSWSPEETLYALLDGQLVELHSVEQSGNGTILTGKGVDSQQIHTFSGLTGTIRLMRMDDSNSVKAKATVSNIAHNERLLRERTITDIAGKDSLVEIFESAEIDKSYGNEPEHGTAYPPQFKTDTVNFFYTPGVGATLQAYNENAKYIWDPKQDRLLQIISQDGPVLHLMDPVKGHFVENPYLDDGSPVQVVKSDDTFSMELIEAVVQRLVGETKADSFDEPGEADPSVIAVLDKKEVIAAVEDIQPPVFKTEADEKPPAAAMLSWTDAYYGLTDALSVAEVPNATWSGIMSDFGDQFGAGNGDISGNVNYAEVEAFLNEKMPKLVGPFDYWISKHAPHVYEPDSGGTTPVEPPSLPHVPASIVGVSNLLSGVSEQFAIGDLAQDPEKAKSMVGKVLMLTAQDYSEIDTDEPINLGLTWGSSPVASLVYAESYEETPGGYGKLWVRLPNGQKKSVSPSNTSGYLRIVEGMDADGFKSAATPVVKADGTITYAGKVIGKWEKEPYGYYSTRWLYTFYGAHTIFGQDVTGKLHKKTDIKNWATFLLVPQAPPVKSKKNSPASKKIAAAVKAIPTLEGATYVSGEKAQLGDWVQSTKGGGGFVGKIVGWPSQETHPGLVFAVSITGDQKTVQVKTMKKVSKPADDLVGLADALNTVPSAYLDLKFSDGSVPLVGQTVEAGKPGEKITGIVHHLNTKQGWVYILTPDGKQVSKTFSVTKVIAEPDLIWDANDAAIASALVTKPGPPKKAKAGPGPSYPGPDDAVIDQPQSLKDAWLADNPKRKLTKDGFVPTVGMRVRNKAGDELVVLSVATEWDPNPNKVATYNLTQQKKTNASTTSIEVDHDAMLSAFDGGSVKKVGTLSLGGTPSALPNGTVIYRYSMKHTWYSAKSGNYREVQDWIHVAMKPDGTTAIIKAWGGASGTATYEVTESYSGLAYLLKHGKPEHFQIVATIDDSAAGSVDIEPFWASGWSDDKKIHTSTITFAGIDDTAAPAAPAIPTPEPAAPEATPLVLKPHPKTHLPWSAMQSALNEAIGKHGSTVNVWGKFYEAHGGSGVMPKQIDSDYESFEQWVINDSGYPDLLPYIDQWFMANEDQILHPPEPEPTPEPTPEPVAAPTPEPELEGAPDGDAESVVIEDTTEPPKIVPTTSITPLAGETPITTATAAETAAIVEPPVPAIGAPVDLSKGNAEVTAPSIAAAAAKMLEQKDSTEVGTGFTYGLGDSDLVEDMLFRHSVERQPDGTEHLVTRFRLREEVSESVMSTIVTTSSNTPHVQKFGGWKTTGQLYPFDLNKGDAIYIRLSGTTGLLKPGTGTATVPDTPNARVAGDPVKVGTSVFEGAEVDLWRVPVVTADGTVGEVDMQARQGASIHVYEWDPKYPIPVNTSKTLQMQATQVALAAGWARVGGMDMDGHSGMKPDEKGIPTYSGHSLGSMTHGSPGSRVRRKMDDGTVIVMNGALSVESGIGNESTRKANIAGEVRVSVPIEKGKPPEAYAEALSKAMQAVGIAPEKQEPPTNEQLFLLALEKFVGTHHPQYQYRGGPLNGANDPRVAQTLARLNKEIGPHLGREVTLDDILIKRHASGRIQFVLSHDVGKAIAKRKGIDYFTHDGASSDLQYIMGGTAPGLLSADERWSLGVFDNLYMHRDMRIGSGDRMYMYSKAGKSYGNHQLVMSAPMIASSLEIYNNYANDSDKYGARGDTNPFLTSGGHAESMYKRAIERELITFYVVSSDSERSTHLKSLKARGITHIGGRPIEEIIVTKDQAKDQGNIEDIGKSYWDDAVPITSLVPAAAAAPAAAP